MIKSSVGHVLRLKIYCLLYAAVAKNDGAYLYCVVGVAYCVVGVAAA